MQILMRQLLPMVVCTAAMAVASPALAQGTGTTATTRPPVPQAKTAKPKPPREPLEFRGFFVFDASMMSASESFNAVTGSSTMLGFGGGFEVHNLWKQLFARFAFATASKSGLATHDVPDPDFEEEFDLDIGLRTIELGGGWRMPLKKHPKLAVSAGGGLLFTHFTQRSSFAPEKDLAESFTGYSVQGGLDFTMSKWLSAGVEAQYRIVPAPSTTGLSAPADFDEDDLGGFVIRGMVVVRFGKQAPRK